MAENSATHNTYSIRMQSLNHVVIQAWLTIPKTPENFQIIIGLLGYDKIIKTLYTDDNAWLQLNIRKDKPKGKEHEYEFVLYYISYPKAYIYRGDYMDCIRAIDFVCENEKLGLAKSRIMLLGGSQGAALALVGAALDKRVCACAADNPIFCDAHYHYNVSSTRPKVDWPVKCYTDYVSSNSIFGKKGVLKTLDYFDPQNFMDKVKCPVVFGIGLLDNLAPPSCIFNAYNKLSRAVQEKSEMYVFPELGHFIPQVNGYYKFVWGNEQSVSKK